MRYYKNMRTTNEIHNLKNNKKIVKELGTKIKDLGRRHSTRNRNKNRTLSKLQVRNKN